MHDALGDALMVEMEYLLAKMKVIDERGSALADLQRILVVSNRAPLRGRQYRRIPLCNLVKLSAAAANQLLVVDCGKPV
jgi:hypothetical protein